MRKKVIAAVVIVALLAAGGYWYQTSRTSAAATKNKTQYVQVPVRKGDIRVTISGTGPMASVNGVSMKSNQSGTVSQLLAKEGDRVKAGQVIMVLDNQNLKSALDQAELDLTNARKNLDNLLNPQNTAVKAQQLKVENARLTLQQRQDDTANLTIKAPQAGVVASVATTEGSSVTNNALLFTIFDDSAPTFVVGIAQEAAARVLPGDKVQINITGFGAVTGTVQQSGSGATPASGNRDASVPVTVALPPTPGIRAGMVGQAAFNITGLPYVVQGNGSVKSQVTEVRAKVAATVGQLAVKEGARVNAGDLLAKLTSDSLELQLKQAGNDLAIAEQNLVNLISPDQDPSGQARTLREKLEQAQINLTSKQSDVGDLQVKAPVDGVISSLTPKIGDRITTNQALFRVADYGQMQVTISVDELDIAKVKMGQTAQITLDALPGRPYTGKVSKINPEGVFRNDIATFEVTVSIDKPEGLMAGMNSSVNVIVENKQGVLWVPAQAVTVRQGKAFVQVLEKDQPVQKEIQVGLRSPQQVEVTGGLNEGDQVITTIIRPNTTTGFPMGGGGMGGGMGGNVPATPAGQAPAGGQGGTQGGGGTRQPGR